MAEKAQEDLEEKKEEQIIEKKKQDSQVEAAKRMLQMKKEHWYALYVQVQHEKKIRDAINQHGEALLAGKVLNYQIKAWVATRKLKRKWSDRVVVCEEVCAPGIVFVNLRMIDKLHIYIDKHIKAFVFDRVSRKAAVIPDDIMNEFVDHYLDDPTLNVSMETPVVGKKVKVLVGPLEGRVGYLVEQKGSHRLLIKVAEFTFSIEVKCRTLSWSMIKRNLNEWTGIRA